MVFSSIVFLFRFLPLFFILYYLAPRGMKNGILFLGSLIFYAWGEPVYVLLMLFSTVVDYTHGRLLERFRGRGVTKGILLSSVIINLFILCFFKYADFLVQTLNSLTGLSLPLLNLPLPIGISFYTFQTMSYTIDVYRGQAKVQRNLLDFGVFVTMFPQLIAGPIVKYRDVEERLHRRTVTVIGISAGLQRFCIGMAKKVLLANNMGELWTLVSAKDFGELGMLTAWLGIVAFAFQIYFDFSGYSDMAIGMGQMLGFHFPENFNYPYISASVTEFWRRWHISLGTWFRDYVYIPLGGNRVSKGKHVRNIMVVWMLTGLWHGAAWNFVMWGLYYGILLLIEKYALAKILEKLPAVVSHIYCLLLVMVGWVFFFSPTLGGAVDYLKLMAGIGGNGVVDRQGLYILLTNGWMWIMLVVGSTPAVHDFYERFIYSSGLSKTKAIVNCAVYAAMFILCIAYLVTESYNPFLYFRF